MSKFCGTCGGPLPEGAAFCGSCGAAAQPAASPSPAPEFRPVLQSETGAPAEFQPVAQAAPVPPASSAPPAAAAKSSSPWVKIAIVAVVIIFVGGAIAVAGVIYVAHKVSQKAQEYKREVLGESPTPAATSAAAAAPATPSVVPSGQPSDAQPAADKASGAAVDVCRLLSKEDVTRAIGVDIVDAASTDGGCSYFAKGKSVDMTAKHATAMVSAKANIDKKTQGMLEQFASAVGNSRPETETSDNDRPDGTTAVLVVQLDMNEAEEQMKLNAKVLGIGAIGGIEPIEGIGDEAFSKADSMMFVRKGDKLIRIMYMSCPCATDAVKPLAKKIADGL
jgi:hypothetical protein